MTRDRRVMVSIIRRQQLVPAAQDKLCLLVDRGIADQHLSLHREMHHALTVLGRFVHDIRCRGNYNRRRRIARFFPARTCRLH
jgi:hypothetical protein